LFLPLWIQKSWGDWQTYGGGGYYIDQDYAVSDKNYWYAGWLLQKNCHGAAPPVGIETVSLHRSRKGAAVLVASDPAKKHGPWVVANLRVVTPSGDPV
jgi:hypothetical protein